MRIFTALIWLMSMMFSAGAQKAGSEEGQPCACCGEKFRQFDFWVGDWNTYGPNGNLVGTNDVVLLQDNCVIQENWVSEEFPYTGTSYNFYDAGTDEWVQTWVDNQGGNLQLRGGLENGSMVLKSKKVPRPEGGSIFNRIAWTPLEDGSVRQHWETSSDYGATWATMFDGLYKKTVSDKK